MRISSNTLSNQLTQGLKDSLAELTDLSNQLSTGKKSAKVSDDVLGTMKVMDYKLSINQNDQYERNITEAKTYLDFNNQVLTQVSDTLVSLKKLISSGGDSSGSPEDRANYAKQAGDLRDYLLDLSNSQFSNRYIYSGFQSDQKAYQYDSANHLYAYQGDSGQLKLPIGKEMNQTINVVGSSNDSTINTVFSYTLRDPGTTTLSDGSLVTYTAVPNPARGDTAIQVQITHPDHPGDPNYEDSFSFSNFMDMANVLTHAWQYQAVDGSALSDAKSMNRIAALSIPLEKAAKQVLTVQADLGIRQVHLEDQTSRLKAGTLSLQNAQSQTEDANLDETIINLQKVATSLNVLRSASAQILSKSLFDFLK